MLSTSYSDLQRSMPRHILLRLIPEYASQAEMIVERGINKKADLVHKDD